MSNNIMITARIDKATKDQAVDILQNLGINTTQAIAMFLRQVIYTRGLPFDVRIPNEETIATLKDTDAGKDLHRVSNVDELFKELKA